jgi:Transposase, Mutator family
VFLDALVAKVRHEGRVINKAIHLALGVNLEGKKELLGILMRNKPWSNLPSSGTSNTPPSVNLG